MKINITMELNWKFVLKQHQMHKFTTDLDNVKRSFIRRNLVNRIHTSTEHLQRIKSSRIFTRLCT